MAPQGRAVARAVQRQKEDCAIGKPRPASEGGGKCFHRALNIARERSTRSLELRAGMSLARLERIERGRGKAHDLVARLYDWFTEGHNTLDLRDARNLLESRR
jgi:hypothetical protein